MFQGKQLVIAAAVLAFIAAGAPQSAEATLFGVDVLGELTDPVFSETNTITDGLGPEWEVEEPQPPFPADTIGTNTADFFEIYDLPVGDPTAILPSLTISYVASSGVPSFTEKTWTFSGLRWIDEPGNITGITATRLGNPAGTQIFFNPGDPTTFSIGLPAFDFASNPNEDSLDFRFLIFAEHGPPSGAPEPGTLLLLGAGLIGLSRMRRRS